MTRSRKTPFSMTKRRLLPALAAPFLVAHARGEPTSAGAAVDALRDHLQFTPTRHEQGPPAAHAFDRFAGSWQLDGEFIAPDGALTSFEGEWHFGWILGGRVLQDVLYYWPPGQRPTQPAERRGGTTVRLFNPTTAQWAISWFAAARGEVLHLQGGPEGDRIVLRGTDTDGSAMRWSFNQISDDGFLWLGETAVDGVAPRVEQRMRVRRM